MKSISEIKKTMTKYRHGLILSYFFVYLFCFSYLEKTVTKFTPMHSILDDYIPFNEWFIIPYLLWFIYIFVTVAYFFFTSKSDFFKCCGYLFIGMTICLLIYKIWPNGHYLRVDINTLGRSNICTKIVANLYQVDTATNVFPSIHVLNSIGAFIAIHKSERLRNIQWIQISSFVLTVAICLSTVFLKQHSILDVFGGIILSIIMYFMVYVPAWGKEAKLVKSKKAQQELSQI